MTSQYIIESNTSSISSSDIEKRKGNDACSARLLDGVDKEYIIHDYAVESEDASTSDDCLISPGEIEKCTGDDVYSVRLGRCLTAKEVEEMKKKIHTKLYSLGKLMPED